MYDITIIGAEIAGCSLVHELGKYQIKTVLIKEESDVSVRATETNGAIAHGGHNPLPDSKMAKYNVTGDACVKELCGKFDIPYKQTGALIMAFSKADERTLEELKNHDIQSGVEDMEIWDKERSHRKKPRVSQEARAALYSPNVGITSPWELALVPTKAAVEGGVGVKPNIEIKNIEKTDTGYSTETNQGVIDAACVCDAADMFADEANEVVNDATFKIESNRGEYYPLDKSQGNLVNHTIFQCPNENGKGVPVAPTAYGNLIVGPDS